MVGRPLVTLRVALVSFVFLIGAIILQLFLFFVLASHDRLARPLGIGLTLNLIEFLASQSTTLGNLARVTLREDSTDAALTVISLEVRNLLEARNLGTDITRDIS